jgi:hypothetical protein
LQSSEDERKLMRVLDKEDHAGSVLR